ncbi:cell surface glycoprotein CD200 receptor 1-like [Antechinus flavipes]|uniref:cell surface glycoprotein CD200 receptor 1-like n=1 Tax=Antechinus flavipes TaxID=38775 RepID=UPI0022360285|nr:cell surface glycoprotein CD200 receptor 1-like [Antechinus flavipes]
MCISSLSEYKSTEAEAQVPSANMSAAQMSPECHTNATKVSVQMDTCVVLSCLHYSSKEFVMATWTKFSRDKASCIIAYRKDKTTTNETNCSGTRITWESEPERNFSLQIEPVTIHHEGYYQCDLVTPDGNFQSCYNLSVLVPPPVINLSQEENGTVVCKAAAGKPAAQISWDPEGVCFTVKETHHNRTVTVKSICTRDSFNASNVNCFISHLTGNRTLSINFQVHSK